jgi:putative ABC transport system permease protein
MDQIKEYFKIALRNLTTRSLRSWLTIFGIVIGVFLIISLLSLSQGLKDTLMEQLQALGGDVVMIMPGGGGGEGEGEGMMMMSMFMGGDNLDRDDLEIIKKTRGVDSVIPMSYSSASVRYEEERKNTLLAGIEWENSLELFQRFQGWSLEEGRWPTTGRQEIILGKQMATEFFDEKVKIGKDIVIEGRRFKIVGTLNSLGNQGDDSYIYIGLDFYHDLTGEEKGSANMAMAIIKDGQKLDKVAEDIEENLEKTRKRKIGEDTKDFSVITSEKLSSIADNILSILQLAIIAFAAIAIAVGGIGITNTMFTSVRERTREIGTMKAIGAKNSAISKIFLIEAGIIGLAGGIGGTVLGITFGQVLSIYARTNSRFNFSAAISPSLILFGLLFSLFIGCLAGFFPARQAARLRPVEALRRYE